MDENVDAQLIMIHSFYVERCIEKGLNSTPLNLKFINAINKYMLVKGFNLGIKPVNEVYAIYKQNQKK